MCHNIKFSIDYDMKQRYNMVCKIKVAKDERMLCYVINRCWLWKCKDLRR